MVDFNYDAGVDILTVDRENRKAEDYSESLAVGDYVVDLDEEGEVLGVEILNAVQNLPFTKKELESIEDAGLDVSQKSGTRTITVNIKYQGQKGAFSLGYSSGILA